MCYALKKGIQFNFSPERSQKSYSMESLAEAAKSGNLRGLQSALARGIRLAGADENGFTLLHMAVAGQNVDVVRFLLEEKASPNSHNHAGQTPLHLAAQLGDELILAVLLENGARVDSVDTEGVSFVY
jgi:ankyrin repeat protein